jgi:hypothetical protein
MTVDLLFIGLVGKHVAWEGLSELRRTERMMIGVSGRQTVASSVCPYSSGFGPPLGWELTSCCIIGVLDYIQIVFVLVFYICVHIHQIYL